MTTKTSTSAVSLRLGIGLLLVLLPATAIGATWDREIAPGRNAPTGVELIGRRKGVRWADIETSAAGTAMVLVRRVRIELGGGEDGAEEQPRTMLA